MVWHSYSILSVITLCRIHDGVKRFTCKMPILSYDAALMLSVKTYCVLGAYHTVSTSVILSTTRLRLWYSNEIGLDAERAHNLKYGQSLRVKLNGLPGVLAFSTSTRLQDREQQKRQQIR